MWEIGESENCYPPTPSNPGMLDRQAHRCILPPPHYQFNSRLLRLHDNCIGRIDTTLCIAGATAGGGAAAPTTAAIAVEQTYI